MKKYSIIIYIVLSIAIFFVVIDPQYKQVQAMLETKKENDVLLERAKQLTRKRQELMTKYNNISVEDKDLLKKVLPETVDNVRLIRNISKIAGNTGIEIRGISLKGDITQEEEENTRVVDRTGRNYGVIQLSFSFSSDYPTMKNFLRKLEQSLRMVDIRTFTVNASQADDVYSYSLTLDTYWLR